MTKKFNSASYQFLKFLDALELDVCSRLLLRSPILIYHPCDKHLKNLPTDCSFRPGRVLACLILQMAGNWRNICQTVTKKVVPSCDFLSNSTWWKPELASSFEKWTAPVIIPLLYAVVELRKVNTNMNVVSWIWYHNHWDNSICQISDSWDNLLLYYSV